MQVNIFCIIIKKQIQRQECAWGKIIPDLTIQFTVGTAWEARLVVSHDLGESKGPFSHEKKKWYLLTIKRATEILDLVFFEDPWDNVSEITESQFLSEKEHKNILTERYYTSPK